jgi:hypothetical protein
MSGLFASGRIVDAILVLTLAEAAFVVWYQRRTGRGPAPGPFVGNLLSGASLLLALRCALGGAWWGWIALCLLGSLMTHLGDLRWRWRRTVN